jgi:hypothetical protein
VGVIAALMLFMGNGVVFAGVQFGITVMRIGEDEEPPQPGLREPVPVPVRTDVPRVQRRH